MPALFSMMSMIGTWAPARTLTAVLERGCTMDVSGSIGILSVFGTLSSNMSILLGSTRIFSVFGTFIPSISILLGSDALTPATITWTGDCAGYDKLAGEKPEEIHIYIILRLHEYNFLASPFHQRYRPLVAPRYERLGHIFSFSLVIKVNFGLSRGLHYLQHRYTQRPGYADN